MLPAGRLEAGLLVPLLHLALAHPAWGQKDGIVTAHNGCWGPDRREAGRRRRQRWQKIRGCFGGDLIAPTPKPQHLSLVDLVVMEQGATLLLSNGSFVSSERQGGESDTDCSFLFDLYNKRLDSLASTSKQRCLRI